MTTEGWVQPLATMTEKWRAITDTAGWQERLAAMSLTQGRLQAEGRWASGPADLMSVAGFHRKELAHGRVLRWLCDPAGSHRHGADFLERLLEATGGAAEGATEALATTEQTRPSSRADLVVTSATWTLVGELKIDANESDRQCERLFEDWRDEPGLRLVFITPSGRRPLTANTPAAVRAWQTLSWADVLGLLDDMSPVSSAVEEYRLTLRRLVGRRQR